VGEVVGDELNDPRGERAPKRVGRSAAVEVGWIEQARGVEASAARAVPLGVIVDDFEMSAAGELGDRTGAAAHLVCEVDGLDAGRVDFDGATELAEEGGGEGEVVRSVVELWCGGVVEWEAAVAGADGEAPGSRRTEEELRAAASEAGGELIGIGLEDGADAGPGREDGGVEVPHCRSLYGFC
jgi:hypothetical protein